ncbi:MAG: CoB--CoM heterodisulfide reductase iron-sulfur subunit B family protein [Ruminococcus sp.]|uniref:CoB--CoM heterodisulfide reductase iron-sulfur subunit B family protein n=1 Tax=Ruminococcus sp. TaxID=41978 RepID=UPI001B1EBFE4|nr:CoB--CoM heterodisulfide reductase iron-sulfur subunit B family protein [Ruminococcus sp.]MBO7472658.1 CoB--CoM heterodisulfide reductase iron-sulfur subunit B family protein [Ruminococcus sp.]
METFTYYPGCTLRTKAKDLDIYARVSAKALNIALEEPSEWQCCGGAYTTAKDEIATKLSAVRVLNVAKEAGRPLITVCSACHNVIKQTNYDISYDEDMAAKVNNYLKFDESYNGETKVYHYLEMLRDIIGFDELAKKVINPLKGKKIAAYYGCLLLRPSKALAMDDPENPSIIEDFIRAIGGTPVIYSQRNECCGGYIALEDKSQAHKRSSAVMKSAEDQGADMIITACPLCMYNLRKNSGSELPVYYFTELLAEALGVKEESNE